MALECNHNVVLHAVFWLVFRNMRFLLNFLSTPLHALWFHFIHAVVLLLLISWFGQNMDGVVDRLELDLITSQVVDRQVLPELDFVLEVLKNFVNVGGD